ncbi:MAG: hypothetical protein LBU13_06460 [Synergistaceae bacterium]|jgi:carbon monoxide dehydrogenase subunit G|nr:hypothetical protein [Synergistaceae bacterium]
MGNAAKILKIPLLRMLHLDTQNTASIAADIAMKLAMADADTEFFTARQNLGEVNTTFRSEYVMIVSILANGNITVAARKMMSRVFIDD